MRRLTVLYELPAAEAPKGSALSVRARVAVLAVFLSTCGPGPNPVPVLSSLSPEHATREGPAFTLTVNGSNFVSGASVLWNGTSRSTTFVSSTQLTAQIATADILVAQTHKVAVANPKPGGGTSDSLPFDVPCILAAPGPASTQTRARIGAYYFDGWAGPLSQPHFHGLVNSPYQGREPLSGWQDNNQCAIEQQLAWAHSFGLSFFVFDWFFNAVSIDPWDENLNSALEITKDLTDRHGMQFAILYVNQDPYVVRPSDWSTAVGQWVGYMTDPGYVRVNGKPLFVVIDMMRMRSTFGSSAATVGAFDELRKAAQAKGLPGVYIVGDISVSAGADGIDGLFPDLSSALADGYDAVTMYGIGGLELPLATSGEQPFSGLAGVAKWIWNEAGLKSPIPFIPLVPDGADPRSPEGDHFSDRPLYWFRRTPQEVATLVVDAITWAESNPRVRPESPPTPPMVLIGTWNELGNGAILVPTLDDGTSYGDALASVLGVPAPRTRPVLTLTESGPPSGGRAASGRIVDANGAPIAGALITLTAAPAGGVFTQQYRLSGRAPPNAVAATVGFRVNADDPGVTWPSYWFAGPGPSDFSLYGVSYVQVADGVERIPNGDFSSGMQGWRMQGQAQLAPSDRGTGQRVQVIASPDQLATLDSDPYPVTPNAPFDLSFSAKVAPSSLGSGYFLLAFIGDAGAGDVLPLPGAEAAAVHAESVPLAPGREILGTATTDSAGNFQFSLASLGTSPALLEASCPGDATHWPSYARSDMPRVVLTLKTTPLNAGPPYLAFGTVLDEAGHPILGEVSVTVQALEGPGFVARYFTSGLVPSSAVTGYVVAEANLGNRGPGPALVTLYEADFQQPGDTSSRIPNGDFSAGATSWGLLGAAGWVVAEDGGVALRLAADAGVEAWTSSLQFPVRAGASFSSAYVARVAPLSTGNGQFVVYFSGASNEYVGGTPILFTAGHVYAGSATTDGGWFSVSLDAFGSGSLEVEAAFNGGSIHSPADARTRR